MTAPNPVTNAEFTRDLASALHRPAILPIPALAARLAFGELADEGLLASARVEPTKLLASGFTFLFPNLGAALSDLV
jgi:NAD dependent epimerase/dehydratase family enzyme